PFASLLPAGFVDVAALLLLNGGVDGAIDRLKGGAALLLQADHTPQTERQAKELRQQAEHLPIAEVVVAAQDGDGGGRARAKGAGRYIGGPLGRNQGAAGEAADRMVVVGSDIGADHGQFPHILGADGTGVVAHVGQRTLAGGAGIWIVIAHLVDLIGVRRGTVMPRMARLSPRLPPAGHTRGARGCGRRIGRGRLGRVLGMRLEPGFKIGDALVERGVGLLELGDLLLLEVDGQEAGTDESTHAGWRCRPIGSRQTCWWCILIHRYSILGTTTAVNHPVRSSSTT